MGSWQWAKKKMINIGNKNQIFIFKVFSVVYLSNAGTNEKDSNRKKIGANVFWTIDRRYLTFYSIYSLWVVTIVQVCIR